MKDQMTPGAAIAIGVGTGVALGVALDNIAIGVAIGMGLAVAFGAFRKRDDKPGGDDDAED